MEANMERDRSTVNQEAGLAKLVDTQLLPPERFKGDWKGTIVDVGKRGDFVAVLKEVEDHFEATVYDGKGKPTDIPLDPSNLDIVAGMDAMSRNTIYFKKDDSIEILQGLRKVGYQTNAEKVWRMWLSRAPEWYSQVGHISASGDYATKDQIRDKPLFFPLGPWKMGILDFGGNPNFVFTCENDWFTVDPKKSAGKVSTTSTMIGGARREEAITNRAVGVLGNLWLREEVGIFRFFDSKGREAASFAGSEPRIDPQDPNSLYFINTGRVYKLDLRGVVTRETRPTVEPQIEVDDPQELDFEPNGNFLVVRSGDNGGRKLHIVDKASGELVKSFDEVQGPVLVDSQGDIIFTDTQNRLREIQTNFQSIQPGGIAAAKEKKAQELRALQERFASLRLGEGTPRQAAEVSEKEVAATLRTTISEQVGERIATATPEELENILGQLQALKAVPENQAYSGVVDEFVGQAQERMSQLQTTNLESKIAEFSKALEGVASVGDTIGLDEKFGELLKLRQSVVVSSDKRGEIDKLLGDLAQRRDSLVLKYQGELVDAINQSFPTVEQLIKECGSLEELDRIASTSQAQQLELMLINIRDPKMRKELRERYSGFKTEQRLALEARGRELEDAKRLEWAQVIQEAREELGLITEEIAQLADLRGVDRFTASQRLITFRARLLALPAELRQQEEDRLQILLSSRRADIEHRRELGAIGEKGELRFGDATFSVYKEPPRVWAHKFVKGEGWMPHLVELVFEDQQGRVFKPDPKGAVVVLDSEGDPDTQERIVRYRKAAEEHFKGIKRRVPEFDEHWRITGFHMERLEEVAQLLNLQIANHRGVLILQGEAGTGKNVLVDILANLSNREVVPVGCNENSVKEDFTYEFHYDPEKGTYKLPSKLIEGIQTPGTIILFDEINALKPGIAKLLNSLFDYRRRIFLPEGGGREIVVDPTVIFIATMNPQNYAGVNRLSPEVKSRARVVDLDYPPFEEIRDGRTYYRSDEAEMLAAYMDSLSGLKQAELKLCWDCVINRDTTNGADEILRGDSNIEPNIRRIKDVISVADKLRKMYQAYQIGDSNEPMDFPTSLREVTDIVMEMNHRQGVRDIIKRVILPKIDDRRQKRMVGETIDAVLPE